MQKCKGQVCIRTAVYLLFCTLQASCYSCVQYYGYPINDWALSLERQERHARGWIVPWPHGTLAGCPKSTGQEAPEHGIS